jgi:hypothetical protein
MDVSDYEKKNMIDDLFDSYYEDEEINISITSYANKHHFKPYQATTDLVEKLIELDEEAAKFSIVIMAKNYLCFYDL